MKKGYVGSISQSAAQAVKAPHQVKSAKANSVVKSGKDLRTGKK